jgi:hypothetical protein
LIHEKIKSGINSGNDSYRSVQNLLPSKKVKIRIYKTIILSVVLYGCETWCHTSKKEHRLKVLENKMLRIFGPKKYDMIRAWRKLHNKELHNLYASPNVIGMIKESGIGQTCIMHTHEEECI